MVTPGYTVPSGDISLESGQPLEIFCVLDPNVSKYNSSTLTFSGYGKEISKEHITIINSTTIRLYIEKPKRNSGLFTCKQKIKNDTKAVCLNKVSIGVKPEEVSNFSCLSHNWRDILCSWIPPYNEVRTTYSLMFAVSGSRAHCPHDQALTPNSCYWNSTTNPTYRQPFHQYKFNLTGSNSLGNKSWIYIVPFYSVVIPDKPRNLTYNSTTVDSISIQWYIPYGLENFPPGLIHKVQFKTKYDEDWQDVDTSSLCVKSKQGVCSDLFELTLTNLKYANTIYNISVRSRTGSKDEWHPIRWSEPAYITPSTKATTPFSPPLTTIGSFEIVSTKGRDFRDVNIYWQELPEYMENGNDFKYKILTVEENGVVVNISPYSVTKYCASFKNLTYNHYRFTVVSWNRLGRSKNYSEVIVPAGDEIPLAPELVTKIPRSNSAYELSWEIHSHQSQIESYTVFWCKKISSSPFQCSNLNWTVVDSSTNIKNVSHLSEIESYELGVSANRQKLSSGIVWASCSVIREQGTDMKKVIVVHKGPSNLYISWKLECSNRIGVVSGFLIEYCASDDRCSDNFVCGSDKQSKIIEGGANRSYNLTDLMPYTNYAIFISIISNSEFYSKSRAQCTKTGEGVPDIIDSVKIVNVTDSSISISWPPPENLNGVLNKYRVNWGGESVPVIGNSYTLENLKSYTGYLISVSACTFIGCGRPSIPKYVVTDVGTPGIPSGIHIKSSNSSWACLSWDRPHASSLNLTYYIFQVKFFTKNNVKHKYETDPFMGNETFLPWDQCLNDGETKYNLRMRAFNELNNNTNLYGSWSEPLEGDCVLTAAPTHMAFIIPLIAVLLTLVLCIFCGVFSQHLWAKFNQMRDISVKLPARLGNRQDSKPENHAIHIWNNHMVREIENVYIPSPDEQSLLKVKEEIEMTQEDSSNNIESFGCDIIQNNVVCGNDSPVMETDVTPTVSPSPGYILVSPQPSGYVTMPPLSTGYMMAALPPSPNSISPPLPQCSIVSLKQNGFPPKSFNSFPEPNNIYGDMVSPINST